MLLNKIPSYNIALFYRVNPIDFHIAQLFMDLKSRKKIVATTERITDVLNVNGRVCICHSHMTFLNENVIIFNGEFSVDTEKRIVLFYYLKV